MIIGKDLIKALEKLPADTVWEVVNDEDDGFLLVSGYISEPGYGGQASITLNQADTVGLFESKISSDKLKLAQRERNLEMSQLAEKMALAPKPDFNAVKKATE